MMVVFLEGSEISGKRIRFHPIKLALSILIPNNTFGTTLFLSRCRSPGAATVALNPPDYSNSGSVRWQFNAKCGIIAYFYLSSSTYAFPVCEFSAVNQSDHDSLWLIPDTLVRAAQTVSHKP